MGEEDMPLMSLVLIVVMAIAQSACRSSIDSEEAAVIGAYVNANIKKLFGYIESDDNPLKIVYIGGVTSGFQPRWKASFSELGTAVQTDTAESFLQRNDREYEVNSGLSFKIPHRTIPEAKLKRMIEEASNWTSIYREFPALHGIVWFSRVGFDARRTQALLYISNLSQRAGREGWLILMQKERRTWREAGRKMIWTD
jgi:hypothetical protein